MSARRDLPLLVGAVGLSALGDFLAVIPLALHLEEASGSGLVLAALFICLWLPSVLFAAPAGLLVDRFETRRLLLAVSLAQAVVATGLAFADGTAAILALTFLLGTGFALAQPAEFALVPAVAGPERLAVANGHVETARYVGFTAGPLLGGLLAAAGGMRAALLVNAASFAVVALVAAVLHARREPLPRAGDAPRERARDGIVFLVRDPTLAVVMTVAFVSLLFMTASAPAEVFFAKDTLDAGDVGYGALTASWTLGMALGAVGLARRIASPMLATAALGAIGIQGLGIALPTLWPVFAFAAASFFVGGLAHGTKNVLVRTLMHERVPERLHGRTFAAYGALRNGAELVALVGGGVLIVAIGARWTLLVAGAVPLAAVASSFAAARRRLAAPPTDAAAVPSLGSEP